MTGEADEKGDLFFTAPEMADEDGDVFFEAPEVALPAVVYRVVPRLQPYFLFTHRPWSRRSSRLSGWQRERYAYLAVCSSIRIHI